MKPKRPTWMGKPKPKLPPKKARVQSAKNAANARWGSLSEAERKAAGIKSLFGKAGQKERSDISRRAAAIRWANTPQEERARQKRKIWKKVEAKTRVEKAAKRWEKVPADKRKMITRAANLARWGKDIETIMQRAASAEKELEQARKSHALAMEKHRAEMVRREPSKIIVAQVNAAAQKIAKLEEEIRQLKEKIEKRKNVLAKRRKK